MNAMSKTPLRTALLLVWLAVPAADLAAQKADARLGETSYDALRFRNIGPATMSGRIVDLAVVAGSPHVFYAASATGGVWKTTNGGNSWAPVADHMENIGITTLLFEQTNANIM